MRNSFVFKQLIRGRLAIAWLMLIPSGVWAQCDYSPWISVWPAQAEAIQTRQVFLLTGNGLGGAQSQASWLQQFGSGIHAYLWSAHDSVDLRVFDRATVTEVGGGVSYTQVLLTPSRPLLPDAEYELRAFRDNENLSHLFRPGRLAPGQKRATAYRWKTSLVPDVAAPRWVNTPVIQQKKYEANSEGIENYVSFSNPLRDSSQYLIKATIRHLSTGDSVAAYLRPWQNQLSIGWFTCSGNVRFKSEEEYTIRFEAVDAAGNRASVSGTPILFRAPKRVACCWGD
ncbi:hypothetical protein GCM10027594_20260 [Hymenobacter agri]